MKVILGTKDRMTQIFDENGTAHPVTILRVAPAMITQLKNAEKDGYEALQIASGEQKEHRVSKAQKGHLGKALRYVKEFRPRATAGESAASFEKGSTIDASIFEQGDIVSVSAISKGKGFQGVVKRHGFSGMDKTHGTKHHVRAPGSIGGGGRSGGRVIKGMRMAGRMGGERVTVKNLKIIAVNKDENVILVRGAVPGRKGTLVEVRSV